MRRTTTLSETVLLDSDSDSHPAPAALADAPRSTPRRPTTSTPPHRRRHALEHPVIAGFTPEKSCVGAAHEVPAPGVPVPQAAAFIVY